jgi:hypothetical protein
MREMGKTRRTTMLVLAVAVALTVSAVPVLAHGAATKQSVSVHAFPGADGIEPMDGSARLVRTDNGISFRMRTDSLTPGDVVTVWYVIFNDPSKCGNAAAIEGPRCSGSDLATEGVGGKVMWAAGSIVGRDGTANWAGHLGVGELTAPHPSFDTGQSLENARGAEVHLVMHTHGAARPGYVSDQLHSFAADGDLDAADLQAAAFRGDG